MQASPSLSPAHDRIQYACTVKEGPETLDHFNRQMYTTADSQVDPLDCCLYFWLVAVPQSSKHRLPSSQSSVIALTIILKHHMWQLQSDWICWNSSRVQAKWLI